jgi:myo-inositol 2-dehydrogenase/D-chiro-inositol 1-dehydrogenase
VSVPKLRVGVVGAGVMARIHLDNLRSLGHESFVYSETGAGPLAAECAAQECGSYADLLSAVDWVVIATPTDTHHALALEALHRARDLIVEKPLARTYREATELVATAESLGRRLLPAHVVRFFPAYVQLRRAVAAGTLGELAVLRFTRAGSFPTRSAWFADIRRSGGIVFDQMIHDLDIARWLAGEVTQVSAVSRHDTSGPAPVQAAHAILRHTSGAVSLVSGVWGASHLEFRTSFSVAGTGGILEHDSARERPVTSQLDGPRPVDGLLPAIDAADDPYLAELDVLLDADPSSDAHQGAAGTVTAGDGAEAVRVAEAALTSLETGQPTELRG